MKYTIRTLLLAAAISIPAAAAVAANNGRVMTNERAAASASNSVAVQSMSSAQIRQLQQSLSSQGYYNGGIDGAWGPGTARALSRYERANSLSSSNVVGRANGSLNGATLDSLGLQLSANDSYTGGNASGGLRADAGTDIRSSGNVSNRSDDDRSDTRYRNGTANTSAGAGADVQGNTTLNRSSGLGSSLGLGANLGADVDTSSSTGTGARVGTSGGAGVSSGVRGSLNQ